MTPSTSSFFNSQDVEYAVGDEIALSDLFTIRVSDVNVTSAEFQVKALYGGNIELFITFTFTIEACLCQSWQPPSFDDSPYRNYYPNSDILALPEPECISDDPLCIVGPDYWDISITYAANSTFLDTGYLIHPY